MIGGAGRNRSFGKSRLIIALFFIGFSLFSYFGSKEYNPVTGEDQYISITPRQEIALGLQAAPQMIRQHGGLYPDEKYQNLVDRIGQSLVENSKASETVYQYEFHLLNERNSINAFALPGGQIFITAALFGKIKN